MSARYKRAWYDARMENALVTEIVPRAFRWELRLRRERELTDGNVQVVRRRVMELARRRGHFTDWPRVSELYEPSLRRRSLLVDWYEGKSP